jgi:hypothetical protein
VPWERLKHRIESVTHLAKYMSDYGNNSKSWIDLLGLATCEYFNYFADVEELFIYKRAESSYTKEGF